MSTSNGYDIASAKSNDGVCEVNDILKNMCTEDNNINTNLSLCANCGMEGSSDNMNICNKCKMVKYCNDVCKKKHRSKHKKQCERYVAELHDIELFKQPPSQFGDCPICFLLLPTLNSGSRYQSCCGKVICSGCFHAPVYDNQGNKVDNEKQNQCPFCRTVAPKSNEEVLERMKKRIEAGDAQAIYTLGCFYRNGEYGFEQDRTKALELYHRAGKLGEASAHGNIGNAYEIGRGVEVDKRKAGFYFELAAMRGNVYARHNLGIREKKAGNMDRALKHHMIAVRSGHSKSLKKIHDSYIDGYSTKEDYTKALQAYQLYLGEIKSAQRDKAAAAQKDCRYY